MTTPQYWVVGGEFGSLNFHSLIQGTQQVQGTVPDPAGCRRSLAGHLGGVPPQGQLPLHHRARRGPAGKRGSRLIAAIANNDRHPEGPSEAGPRRMLQKYVRPSRLGAFRAEHLRMTRIVDAPTTPRP